MKKEAGLISERISINYKKHTETLLKLLNLKIKNKELTNIQYGHKRRKPLNYQIIQKIKSINQKKSALKRLTF